MSEDQKRIIKEQLQANDRMVRRNAERGAVYAHGQGPVNERVYQIRSFLKMSQQPVRAVGTKASSISSETEE